jgi:hypothetical protein
MEIAVSLRRKNFEGGPVLHDRHSNFFSCFHGRSLPRCEERGPKLEETLQLRCSAIIEGTVAWYVDAQTGAVGRARLIASEPRDPAATTRAEEVRGRSNQPPAKRDFSAAPAIIVEGRPVPHLTLFKATSPAGTRGAAIDVAQLRFLYGEASVDLEDERQFARNPGAGVSSLVLPAISGCSR